MADTASAGGPTAHEVVRERLRREIYEGARAPGSRLAQTDIAQEYGVSVTPVREAMRDLVHEGLITADPHKAARVRALNIAEAVEINDLRLLLEPFAVRRATPRLSDAEIGSLVGLSEEMGRAATPVEWIRLNEEFHMVIINATRSPNLIEMLVNLRMVSRFYFEATVRAVEGNYRGRDREHDELIRHFRNRDEDSAAAAMEAHIAPSSELRRRLSLSA
jgi:DNA-binding GntR family transcriptional regulator